MRDIALFLTASVALSVVLALLAWSALNGWLA